MTIRTELESYVQVQFGTDLYGFIKQKAQVEGLYDHEIASLLKVNRSTVVKWRRAYGIKKADAFKRRFGRKYGKGSLEKFKKMAKDPDTTLTDIGKHFGFSKQYASEVYKKIYGSAYRKTLKKKRQIRNKERLSGGTRGTAWKSN
jgi:hypothetical protein